MKHTRKKMLLSSVAMLLVALVALGSATYAWFTVNKEVTAGTMQVTSAAPSGLQITGNNGANWGTTVSYAANDAETLYPVSLDKDATTGYYPRAVATEGVWASGTASLWTSAAVPFTGADSLAGAGDANEGKAVTCDGYYRVYKVGVRSEDGSNIGKVKATIAVTGAGSNFTKVQLFNAAKTSALLNYTDESYNAVASVSSDTPTTGSAITNNASAVEVISDLSTNGTNGTYFYAVVYFEGNDQHCVNNNAGNPGNVTLTFTLA